MATIKRFEDIVKLKGLNEADFSIADEFISKVKNSFLSHFPNGYFYGKAENGLGSPIITFSFGLISDINDESHKIRENDPISQLVMIHTKGDFNADNLKMNVLKGRLNLKPETGSYMAMQGLKTGLKNMNSGSLDKIYKSLDSFFPKLVKLVQDNKDNFYKQDIPSKYFNIK